MVCLLLLYQYGTYSHLMVYHSIQCHRQLEQIFDLAIHVAIRGSNFRSNRIFAKLVLNKQILWYCGLIGLFWRLTGRVPSTDWQCTIWLQTLVLSSAAGSNATKWSCVLIIRGSFHWSTIQQSIHDRQQLFIWSWAHNAGC